MSVELILKDLNIPKFEGKTGSDITTFKIGGALKNLIYVNNKQKLSKLLQKFYLVILHKKSPLNLGGNCITLKR